MMKQERRHRVPALGFRSDEPANPDHARLTMNGQTDNPFEHVEVLQGIRLEDYAEYVELAPLVAELQAAARTTLRALARPTIWIVSSTRQGGGVAESLPRVVALLRQLGLTVEWVVVQGSEPRFFELTKRIHNQLHGVPAPRLSRSDRKLYDAVSDEVADALTSKIGPDDILIVHDPQPLGAGARVKRRLGVPAFWRCHIGLDQHTAATDDAWQFLKEDTLAYDRTIFTLKDYAPPFLAANAATMAPGIDPLSHKNRDLSVHKTTGILVDAALLASTHPALAPPFEAQAQRLQGDGTFAPATFPEDLGLLFRPIVMQISRWDRLKGFGPLLAAFALLKDGARPRAQDDRHRLRIEHARLVLAGPDPEGVHDDPEAEQTLAGLCEQWRALPMELQRDIALLKLPLVSVKDNALMVNALQRCSTIIVQNSIREGFGLTVTEAMWKARPILGGATPGIRAQISDAVTGRLMQNPEDPEAVAQMLDDMLAQTKESEAWGRNARRRVMREFLIFNEVRFWLEAFASVSKRPGEASHAVQ